MEKAGPTYMGGGEIGRDISAMEVPPKEQRVSAPQQNP